MIVHYQFWENSIKKLAGVIQRTLSQYTNFKFHLNLFYSQKVFESFGFHVVRTKDQEMLSPPHTNLDTEQGRSNRERLLRAWVEVSAYLVDFQRRFGVYIFPICRLSIH